ncbi:MAG: hypothetical protein H3C34_11100 [Caldilineaceae bacterium]|nr:hypothetical protein [Caldilineaceae bacterium]
MPDEYQQNNFPQVKPTFRFPLDQNLDVRLDTWGKGARRVVQAARPIVLYQTAFAGARDPNWYYFAVESDKDLTVYGDVVKIAGRIQAQQRSITIVARVLQTDRNGDQTPVIDVSGTQGADALPRPENWNKADNGQPGQGEKFWQFHDAGNDRPGGDGKDGSVSNEAGDTGSDGMPGGSIQIVCRQYVPAHTLDLIANGGEGGTGGRGGQGQSGGDGGPGGDARLDFGFVYNDRYYSTPGGNGGKGGRGGKGGPGGAGGAGGTVKFLAAEVLSGHGNKASTEQSVFSAPAGGEVKTALFINAAVKGGANGSQREGGPGGHGGAAGRGGRGIRIRLGSKGQETSVEGPIEWAETYRDIYKQNKGFGPHHTSEYFPSPPGNAGKDGDTGPRGDPASASPKAGSVTLDFGRDLKLLAQAIHHDGSSFALEPQWDLLRQLRMSCQRARALYLTAGTSLPDAADDARTALIVEVYQVLDWISVNLEAIPPSTDANLANLHRTLSAQANSLLDYHIRNADAFGHYNLYVPRGSFSFYYEQLNHAMGLLYKMETDYGEVVERFKQADDFLAQVDQHAIDVSQHLDALSAEITMTSAELGQVADLISELDAHVSEARGQFERQMRDFRTDLERTSGLDWEDWLDALEMMAFVGSDLKHALPMAAVQLAKLGHTALTEIKTDSGRKIKKDYVLTQIEVMTGDFSKVGEGFRALKAGRPVSVEDQGAARLYVEQSKFDAFFDDFLTKHSALTARDALNAYVNSVQERNLQIDTYNLLLARYIDDQNQVKSLYAQQNMLAATADMNLRRQMTKDYLLSAYNSLRDRCVRLLYLAGRAFYFLSLEPLDLLSEQLGLGKADEINLHSIIVARSRIIDADADAIEERVNPISKAPPTAPEAGGHGATIAFVRAARDHGSDVAHYDLVLRQPQLLDRLEATLNTSITLSWDSMKSHGGKNPFSGKANIRLRRVRCWIYGMQTNNNQHRIRMVHGGDEEIIRTNGEAIQFKHAPLRIQFEYDASDPKRMEDFAAIADGGSEMPLLQEDGSLVGQGIDLWNASHYAPVGPFTNWKITIGPNLNDLVQPVHIDKLVLEFFYYYDPGDL